MRASSALALLSLAIAGCHKDAGPPGLCDPAGADSPGVAGYRATIDHALTIESDAMHLNRPLNIPYFVIVNATHLNTSEPESGAYACPIAGPMGDTAPAAVCEIHIEPELSGYTDGQTAEALAHEAFHCLQFPLISVADVGTLNGGHKWVLEGAPSFAGNEIGEQYFGTTGKLAAGNWTTYVQNPETPLFSRSYDAIGFYAQLRHVGIDPWKRFDAQLLAARTDDKAAWDATAGDQERFLDTWASSYFRIRGKDGFNADWDMDGPGLRDSEKLDLIAIPIDNGGSASFTAAPFTVKPQALKITADVLQLNANGRVRAHDGVDLDIIHLGESAFCTKPDGCVCPESGAMLALADAKSPFLLALVGDVGGASAAVAGVSLDDFCKNPPLPSVPPDLLGGTCDGGSCGRSHGDPHLLTFDGRAYAFQGAGEFILARASGGGLEIQARSGSAFNSRFVSLNSALAMNVADHRVGFYLKSSGTGVTVNLDGAEMPLADGALVLLPGGGFLHLSGFDYSVTWPDGSQAFVRASGYWGLNVIVKPAPARAGTLSGLLGDFNGAPENDLRTRDGSGIAFPPSFDELYHTFGESWRITPEESLFDYAVGESTATLTDRTFPDGFFATTDLPISTQTSAHATCAGAGIVDAQLLDDCTLDVGATGHDDFAATAKLMQDAFMHVPPGTILLDGPASMLHVDTAGATATATFMGSSGTKIFVDVTSSSLPDQCGVITLYAPSSAVVASGCIVSGKGFIDGTVLPETGTYTLLLDPGGTATGTATIRLISAHDQSGSINADGASVDANIAQPGAVARFDFSGTAGQRVFVDVPATSFADQCNVIALLDSGSALVGNGCVTSGSGYIDALTLSSTGKYTIVVDPPDRTLGTATLRLFSVVDQTGTLTLGGPSIVVNIDRPGKRGLLSVSAASSQTIVFDISAATFADDCSMIYLHDPSDAYVASGCVIGGAGTFTPPTLGATGSYTLFVDPSARTTGKLTISAHAL